MSTTVTPLPRTQAQIVERLRSFQQEGTPFDFRPEVLLMSLDYGHAREFLKPEVTAASWDEGTEPPELTVEAVLASATSYLEEVGWEKARDHRSNSAARTQQKMIEWAWLLGRDDAVEAMQQAPYAMFGVPSLVIFAKAFDLEIPADAVIASMSQGRPCRTDCTEGCR